MKSTKTQTFVDIWYNGHATPAISKKRQNSRAIKWFKSKISKFGNGRYLIDRFGNRVLNDHFKPIPAPMNTKEVLTRNSHRFPKQLTYRDFNNHFYDLDTVYYTAAETGRDVLIMIDVDCKRRGTHAGAMAYLQHLADTIFPNLYLETSTNGNGGHGYLLVQRKLGWNDGSNRLAHEFRAQLKKLERYLDHFAAGFDVEMVEIKGTPSISTWIDKKVVDVSYGQLAKLPREMVERFDELYNTFCLEHWELLAIPDHPKRTAPQPIAAPSKPKELRTSNNGSIDGSCVSSATIKNLNIFRDLAERYLKGGKIAVNKDVKATVDDAAIFLALLYSYGIKPNPDNSLPRSRFESDWNRLYSEGSVNRQFNPARFVAMRKYFESWSIIEMLDNEYIHVSNKKTGRGMKWKMNAEIFAELHISLNNTLFPSCVKVDGDAGKNHHNSAKIDSSHSLLSCVKVNECSDGKITHSSHYGPVIPSVGERKITIGPLLDPYNSEIVASFGVSFEIAA